MNRLPRVVLLLVVVQAVLIPVTAAPAQADPIGEVIVIPGTGTDLDPIRLRTSAGCPAKANAYYARMRGRDFPPDGQIITSSTKAGLSHSIGFDVYVALIMRDYAEKNRTTLGGRYDITVYCINRLTLESYGEFTGSLEFTSPKTYEGIGAAKPVGPPPPPLERAADGSAIDPDAASPPSGAPSFGAPSLPGPTAQPAPPDVAQIPGDGPQVQFPAGQRASQHNDVTVQGASWQGILILIGVVLGAALVVVVVVTRQIRRRRAS